MAAKRNRDVQLSFRAGRSTEFLRSGEPIALCFSMPQLESVKLAGSYTACRYPGAIDITLRIDRIPHIDGVEFNLFFGKKIEIADRMKYNIG